MVGIKRSGVLSHLDGILSLSTSIAKLSPLGFTTVVL